MLNAALRHKFAVRYKFSSSVHYTAAMSTIAEPYSSPHTSISPRLTSLKPPPKLHLAQLPTPLLTYNSISALFDNTTNRRQQQGDDGNKDDEEEGVHLSLKLDSESGSILSGNKIRKLEYILYEAKVRGATAVITCGGVHSNHARATAAAAALCGLRCYLLLRNATDEEHQPLHGNLLLDLVCGAKVYSCTPAQYRTDRGKLMSMIAELHSKQHNGETAFIIPEGGSTALGCWGYIEMMTEIMDQYQQQQQQHAAISSSSTDPLSVLPYTDIFVTAGSAGTLAGLLIARELLSLQHIHIYGISIAGSISFFQEEISIIVDEFNQLYHYKINIPNNTYTILVDYIGKGYGQPYDELADVILNVSKQTGILLDPTYTAKAFYGMMDIIKKGKLNGAATATAANSGVHCPRHCLFVHTGGLLGLLSDAKLIQSRVVNSLMSIDTLIRSS